MRMSRTRKTVATTVALLAGVILFAGPMETLADTCTAGCGVSCTGDTCSANANGCWSESQSPVWISEGRVEMITMLEVGAC